MCTAPEMVTREIVSPFNKSAFDQEYTAKKPLTFLNCTGESIYLAYRTALTSKVSIYGMYADAF